MTTAYRTTASWLPGVDVDLSTGRDLTPPEMRHHLRDRQRAEQRAADRREASVVRAALQQQRERESS